jgi:hypothetical protein
MAGWSAGSSRCGFSMIPSTPEPGGRTKLTVHMRSATSSTCPSAVAPASTTPPALLASVRRC